MNKDLTKEVTVFLISAGDNPNYEDCLQALKRQTVTFKLEIIKDYFPLSKAFQEMLNRCKTKYYIEVDEDMILNPNAIEVMYNKIIILDDKHPIACYTLLDTHLNFEIIGIKIYKYDDFIKYPYNLEHPSCEMEQLNRMVKEGYKIDDSYFSDIVGKHSPHWNNELIFERYYNLMEKFKIYKYIWMESLPKKLLEKFKKNPTSLNFYAISGALASIYSDKVMDEEKDVRTKRKQFKNLDSYLEDPHQATVYMTSKCNFKCNFCLRQHQDVEQAPDMDVRTIQTLLYKFPSIKGVCICGYGEPLLSPNLGAILQELKKAKKVVGLITNGYLLAQKLPELIGWYQPDYISVSLNAHCKEFHEKEVGIKDAWDSVLLGIKKVIASPIPLYVSSVVTSENLVYIPQFLKLVKSLGVKTVHLHNLLPHFDESKNEHFWKLVLQKGVHEKFIEDIKKLPEADIVKKYPTLIDKSGGKQTCNFLWRTIQIDGNGSINLCNSVYPCKKEHGNLNDFVVWHNKYCQKFREDFIEGKIEGCKKCFRNFDWGF